MSSNISELQQAAATYLNCPQRAQDIVLEGVLIRIEDLHKQDCLDASAIAARLGDTFGTGSVFRELDFIQFVIERL